QLRTELAEDLAAAGHDVWVVAGPALSSAGAPVRGPWLFRRERRNGVSVLRARGTTASPRRFAGRALNYVSYFVSACVAGLAAPRPDVVVALTDPPIIGLAARLAARRGGAAFVLACHDLFPEVTRLLDDFRSAAVDRMLERVSRHLLRRADRVVALGEAMRARLVDDKGADPSVVRIIHNWADCARIAPG